MASVPGRAGSGGHEGFVNPSSYLRPEASAPTMPQSELTSAVERDQRLGLVSLFSLLWSLFAQDGHSGPRTTCPAMRVARSEWWTAQELFCLQATRTRVRAGTRSL